MRPFSSIQLFAVVILMVHRPALAKKRYWTDVGTVTIQRPNLDGSAVEDLVTAGLVAEYGIDLHVPVVAIPAVPTWELAQLGIALLAAGSMLTLRSCPGLISKG